MIRRSVSIGRCLCVQMEALYDRNAVFHVFLGCLQIFFSIHKSSTCRLECRIIGGKLSSIAIVRSQSGSSCDRCGGLHLCIGKLCGNGPRLWLAMQAAHDLWQAQKTVDVSKIPTLEPV